MDVWSRRVFAGSPSQSKPSTSRRRIVVIGAGMSGLAAAHELAQRGHDVIIVEARDRTGGRIWSSASWPGMPVDLGASWIHGTKGNPLTRIADEIKTPRVATAYDRSITYDTAGTPLSPKGENELDKLRGRIQRAIRGAQDAEHDQSIRQAIYPIAASMDPSSDEYRRLNFIVSTDIEHDYAGSADRLSAYWFDSDSSFGGGDVLFRDGFQTITNHLARGLDIQFNQPVHTIDTRTSPARVMTSAREFLADHVVVTLPLGVLQAQDVQFIPPLPEEKIRAIGALGMGVLNKCFLRFERAFWPDDIDWLEHIPAQPGVWTSWVSHQSACGWPILMGFIAADHARDMESWTDEQIVSSAMDTLKTIFGTRIPALTGHQITRWARDPFTRGSYSYYAVGSTPDMRNTLAAPVGKTIFFAGEAAHRDYFGTAHGAYLSGIRAAEEICAI